MSFTSKRSSVKSSVRNSSVERTRSDQLINGTWIVGQKIGSGSYGTIRIGEDRKNGQRVAIKLEPIGTPDSTQVQAEYQFYQELQGKKGFPQIYYFGIFRNNYVLVMEMLGKNLENVFDQCGRFLSLKSIIFIALQLLKRFQTLHQCRIVYRDVKPENFLLGLKSNTIHVIDFGLSKFYIDTNGRHVADQKTHEIIGTSRYMSINAHLCREQSRKDDLESLGYVLIYFLRQGKLPWSGLKIPNFTEHNHQICELKRSTPDEELCQNQPEEFLIYMKYVRELGFEEEPNYEKLRNRFKRLFYNKGFRDDGLYDWNKGEQ